MSGALFIVLEDVLRIVKQTNNARANSNTHGNGNGSITVHVSPLKSPSPKGIEKDKVQAVFSTDQIDFIPIGSPPQVRQKDIEIGRTKDEDKGKEGEKDDEKRNEKDKEKEKKKEKENLKERRKKTMKNLEYENDDDLDSETERNLFRQARDRKQSINQQFQMEWNEKDDGQYDQEISTKSELHTYASYARKKGKKCLSRPPSIATDLSIGKRGKDTSLDRKMFIKTHISVYRNSKSNKNRNSNSIIQLTVNQNEFE